MSNTDEVTEALKAWKTTLLTRLLDALKQCQAHFGTTIKLNQGSAAKGTKELAVESDVRVACLLAQLEAVFHHGLRGSLVGKLPTLRQMTQFVTTLNYEQSSSSDYNFWACLRCVLDASEVARFMRLQMIRTDAGRGRAWLRAALNERSLERHLETLLANGQTLVQYYEDWAFLRDDDLAQTLPQVAKGLSTLIFAFNIDNPDLNSVFAVPEETSDLLSDARKAPKPVMSVGGGGGSGTNSRAGSTSSSGSGRKPRQPHRRKPLVNLVSFDDKNAKFADMEGRMRVVHGSPTATVISQNPLVNSLIHSWNTNDGTRRQMHHSITADSTISAESDETFNSAMADQATMRNASPSVVVTDLTEDEKFQSVSSMPPELRQTDLPAIETLVLAEDSDDVFLQDVPAIDKLAGSFGGGSDKLSSIYSEDETARTHEDGANHSINSDGSKTEELERQVRQLRQKCDALTAQFQAKTTANEREKESLRSQLKTYIDAVKLLEEEKDVPSTSAEGTVAEMANGSSPESEDYQISCYEEKLIQVAGMHAELVEFNEHLLHKLSRRQAQLRRLRQELIQIRGPIGSDYCSDEETNNLDSSSTGANGQRHSSVGSHRPIVNIWVPTAFLLGKAPDIHHVYQVYLRVGNCEWNVYRRYSDFVRFHQAMKKKDSLFKDFTLPPKKSLGKKERKFVEERRKGLELYLRTSVNHVVQTYPEFAALPVNKETLCAQLTFLKEK